MKIVITRTVVIPGWLLACALVVILAPPAAAGGLLLFSGVLVLAATFLGRHAVRRPVGDRLPTIDVRPVSGTAVEPPAVRPRSWPDSGFRNIGRGTKGG
jgi:hypothetical protein